MGQLCRKKDEPKQKLDISNNKKLHTVNELKMKSDELLEAMKQVEPLEFGEWEADRTTDASTKG